MSDVGKTNIVVMWTMGPEDVAEGDRIFESHVAWMEGHPAERRHRPTVLQDLQGPRTIESGRPELRADGQHDLRSQRGLRNAGRCGRTLEAGD